MVAIRDFKPANVLARCFSRLKWSFKSLFTAFLVPAPPSMGIMWWQESRYGYISVAMPTVGSSTRSAMLLVTPR